MTEKEIIQDLIAAHVPPETVVAVVRKVRLARAKLRKSDTRDGASYWGGMEI